MTAPPIGIPINVRRSPKTIALNRSPRRLMPMAATASRCPQRARLARPIAAKAQTIATTSISSTPHRPSWSRPTRAGGLSRHIDSRIPSGNRSARNAKEAISAPNTKKTASSVTPRERSMSGGGRGGVSTLGRYSEAMRVAVIVGDKELGLSVIAIHDLGNRVAVLQQALPHRLDVARRPVEPDALVRLRLDRRALSLIEPERQALIMNHASDEAPLVPHRPIHGQPKPIDPEAQTLFQVRAGYDGNARLKMHVCLRVSLI